MKNQAIEENKLTEDDRIAIQERQIISAPPFWKNFVAGTVGGISLVLAGHPLDTIKVRLQTMNVVAGQPPPFKNALDCAAQTIRKEGFFGLYKGVTSPLAGVASLYAICFSAYGWAKRMQQKENDDLFTLTQAFKAGVVAGIATTVVTTPMELIKLRLQTQSMVAGEARYTGAWDCINKIVKAHGISGLYRGTVATLMRDLPGSGGYFAVYEGTKQLLTPKDSSVKDLGPLALLFSGGMAGVANWLFVLPIDTLKSRIQAAPEGTYSGMMDCYRKLVKAEGHSALFRGLGPIMLRAFPANAACFLGFELAMKGLNRTFKD